MIKLTEKGMAIFEGTRDLSANEVSAIQSIMYERVTSDNFEYITGLPQRTLGKLTDKGLIKPT